MPDWAVPPNAEGVPTPEAAKLMGFSLGHFTTLMRKYKVSPVREYVSGNRVAKFWNPAVVLQVRAAHRLPKIQAKRERRVHEEQRTRMAKRHTARAERLDVARLKILQRVAKRTGTTVQLLCIDKGLEAWYRSLPPKHKEAR